MQWRRRMGDWMAWRRPRASAWGALLGQEEILVASLSLQQAILPCSSFLQQQHSFSGVGAGSAAKAAVDMVRASAPSRYLVFII